MNQLFLDLYQNAKFVFILIDLLYLFLYSPLTQILTIQSPLMFELKCANKV